VARWVAFTVSIGVALMREGEAASKALERADAAGYRAKAGGRNRVESG
jgi:PleD family two-component response regulator